MRKNHNSLIDDFADIAESMGIFDKSAPVVKSAADKSRNELSAIEALYGIKPEGIKGGRELINEAHPETIVITPTYDAMNAVLENVNQRQDIMAQIALSVPNGNFFPFKYVSAYNDLTKSLVKAAFHLDNEGDDELMKLADDCAFRLEKEAALPLMIGGLVALIGAISAINHTSNSRQSVIANSELCLNELRDLQGKMPVDNIVSSITSLMSSATSFETIKLNAFTPQELISAAKSNKESIKGSQDYLKKLNAMMVLIPKYITQVKTLQPSNKADWDWWQKVKDVAQALIPDDVSDVVNALEGLQKAVSADIAAVNLVMQQSEELAPELNSALKNEQKPEENVKEQEEAPEDITQSETDQIFNQIMSNIQSV